MTFLREQKSSILGKYFAEVHEGLATGLVETTESLRWLRRSVGRGDAATYHIQIVNEPP